MTTQTPPEARDAAPLWPHVVGFFLLTALTVAVFHFSIKLRGQLDWPVELAMPAFATLLAVGLAVFPRAKDRDVFWAKVAKLLLWVLTSIASVVFHRPLLFYVCLLALFFSTYRRCIRPKMPSHPIGAAMVIAWLMSGIVLSVLLWLPRFHDLARMKYLTEASIYIDIRLILMGAGALTVATLAIVRGIQAPVVITPSEVVLHLPLADEPPESPIRHLLHNIIAVVNMLLLDHVEQFIRTVHDMLQYAYRKGQAIVACAWEIIKNHLFDAALFFESVKSSAIFLLVLLCGTLFWPLANSLVGYLKTGTDQLVPLQIFALVVVPAVVVQLCWKHEREIFLQRATIGVIYLLLVLTCAKWTAYFMDLFSISRLTWGSEADIYNWAAIILLLFLAISHFLPNRRESAKPLSSWDEQKTSPLDS